MKVYECFPFFKELDLLELHLAETDQVVDAWVIVELPRTFTDLPKPLYLEEAILSGRLERWRGKIRLIRCHTIPSGPHPTVDWFQRKQLSRGIMDAKADDLIVLTDLDEIPNRDVLARLKVSPPLHPVTLTCDLFYYCVEWKDKVRWHGPIVTPRGALGEQPDMQRLRDHRTNLPQIAGGGWHFSWLGTEEQILEKLEAVDIGRECDIYGRGDIQEPPHRREFVEECRLLGKDLFGRADRDKIYTPIKPGIDHPHEIEEWLAKYPQYSLGVTA